MSDKNENGGFELIALSNVKNKKTNKEGTIGDLFKCVESLATSTEHLRDYVGSIQEQEYRENIARYLQALNKIQDGLLEIAQNKIRGLSEMPEFDDIAGDGKIGSE